MQSSYNFKSQVAADKEKNHHNASSENVQKRIAHLSASRVYVFSGGRGFTTNIRSKVT